MKIVFRIVLLAALMALGVWLWTALFPRPEKVIRKRLTELARTVSSSANESDLARLASARSVAGFFAATVELNVDLPELGQRNSLDHEEITQLTLMARSRAGGVRVKFPDINITVAPNQQSAVADLTVEANISGEHDSVVREMKFTLQKTDGQWLITRIETVRTLARR
jgi:acyl CoA:acetate/3-ketoacid CoA transferase alpha subunit